MYIFIVWLGLQFCACMPLYAQGSGDLFRQANDAYAKSDFAGALQVYEQLINESQLMSPEVYYNIGNTYYRQGKVGKAILYWERALKITPRDKDIKFNLSFVRSKLFAESEENKIIEIILQGLVRVININEISWIVLLIYVVCVGAMIGYIFLKRQIWLTVFISAVCLLIFFGTWMALVYRYQLVIRRGIVVASTAQVHNGPDDSFKIGFTITEGTETVLLRESGDWQEIGISDRGLRGWAKKDIVEAI